MPDADLKRGFLSDSLRESPQKIGIADRPEAGPLGLLDFVALLKRLPFGSREVEKPT
jgi:hypothetical protein